MAVWSALDNSKGNSNLNTRTDEKIKIKYFEVVGIFFVVNMN